VTPGSMSASPLTASVDRLDQLVGWRALEEEPSGAGFEGAVDVVVGVEGGDDHDGDGICDVGSGEKSGGFHAVQVRHPDIEQTHVGAQPASEGHSLASVGRRPDHVDVGLAGQDGG